MSHGKLKKALAVIAVMLLASAARAEEMLPLHERIDRLVEAAAVGGVSPLASDEEFLRRVSLDLTGMSPTVTQTRAFLADAASDKRVRLVDSLLASPEYARRMSIAFDVMLMERRADKVIPTAEWRAWLYEAFRVNKPWNELAGEVLAADGLDPAKRSAARFYLDRDAEPNLIARDVGRIFFGRDMQCAQCHDHPLIDDYFQTDYHGLLAFVLRGSLFTDKDKRVVLAEKGEGDAAYQSVFIPDSKGVMRPRLPGGREIDEPFFPAGEEYTVKPDKEVRPVPKYSRFAQLGKLAAAGENDAFRRNIANRLWALMVGRGLVHPLDLHHSGNPPTNPKLLDLLASEFAAMKFDIKAMLREIALSRTYQRSLLLPEGSHSLAANVAARLAEFETARTAADAAAAQSREALSEPRSRVLAAQQADSAISIEAAKAKGLAESAMAAAAAAAAAVAPARQTAADGKQAAELLAASTAKLQQLDSLALGDYQTEVEAVVAALTAQSQKSAARATALEQAAIEKEQAAKTAAAAIATTTATHEAAATAAAAARQTLAALDAEIAPLLTESGKQESEALLATGRLNQAQLLAKYAQLGPQSAGGQASELETELAEDYSKRFASAPLAPLSPEQLGWSMLQAIGIAERERATAAAEWEKANPLPDGSPAEAAAETSRIAARDLHVEKVVFEKLQPSVAAFVNLFAGAAGQPQDEFFATVDQALFFANGGHVRGWLAPGGGNLTERLNGLADPQAFAEELYLSVLCRRPTKEETQQAADYLAPRATDRAAAVQEIVWALLTSAEFRFSS